MAAHRYWRAVGLEAYGAGDLELSSFHLLDGAGARVDAPATLAANTAPTVGSVTDLQDGNLTTAARWGAQAVATLKLNWDFGGSPVDVMAVQLAGDSFDRFLLMVGVQYSDDTLTWVEAFTCAGVTWPGASAATSIVTVHGTWSRTDLGALASVSPYGNIMTCGGQHNGRGSNARSSGVLQFEIVVLALASTGGVGVATASASLTTPLGSSAGGYVYTSGGAKYLNGSSVAYSGTYTVGDVIGVVVNFTTGSLTFYKNGVSLGVASATGLLGLTLYPAGAAMSGATEAHSFSLVETNFTYPVGGASPWGVSVIAVARSIAGRVTAGGPITLGTIPAIVYGIPQEVAPVYLGVESGAIKDYITGVMGTGRGRVQGTVKETGSPNTPVYRKVRLIREIDGLLMRELWSHPITGAYSFDFVDELQKFTVLSYDHTGAFRAVVADGQIPELIP